MDEFVTLKKYPQYPLFIPTGLLVLRYTLRYLGQLLKNVATWELHSVWSFFFLTRVTFQSLKIKIFYRQFSHRYRQ